MFFICREQVWCSQEATDCAQLLRYTCKYQTLLLSSQSIKTYWVPALCQAPCCRDTWKCLSHGFLLQAERKNSVGHWNSYSMDVYHPYLPEHFHLLRGCFFFNFLSCIGVLPIHKQCCDSFRFPWDSCHMCLFTCRKSSDASSPERIQFCTVPLVQGKERRFLTGADWLS